ALRRKAGLAFELYTAAGDAAGVIRARQALVLGVYLTGDYALARRLEEENLDGFRRAGRTTEVANSLTLLSGINLRLREGATAWARMTEALRSWLAAENASGVARGLAMA